MDVLLIVVGNVFIFVIGWVGIIVFIIAGQPILLLCCVGIFLCGFGVGMFKCLLFVCV